MIKDYPRIEMFSIFKYGNGLYEIVGGKDEYVTDHMGNTLIEFVAEFVECLHEDAVKWNPHNNVVQCHRCGQVFEVKEED